MKTFGSIKHGKCPCCNSQRGNKANRKAAKRSGRQQAKLAMKKGS